MSAVREALRQVAGENPGLEGVLTEERCERLERYHELLARWGAALNLARRRDALDWARADVADSFRGLGVAWDGGDVPRGTAEAGEGVGAPSSVMDIGSGAGFPGVAAALLWPSTPMRWVEASKKRVSFLQRVVRELGLDQVEVDPRRVEDVSDTAALVTSRATFPWQRLGAMREVVSPRGRLAAFVGREPSAQEWGTLLEGWGWRGELRPYEVRGLGPRAIAVAGRDGANL